MSFSNKGPTLVARLTGELDHHSSDYVRQKIDAEIMKSTNKNLVFDFKGVGFMDSSGIGLVIGRYKKVSRMRGKTAIVDAKPHIRRVLEVSGIVKVVPVYDKLDDALECIS